MCVNNNWGTVCDDSWDMVDASVACRQAGFSAEGAMQFSNARFGEGNGSIILDDVACTGTENRLIDCTFNPNSNCGHNEDAGIRCQRSESF